MDVGEPCFSFVPTWWLTHRTDITYAGVPVICLAYALLLGALRHVSSGLFVGLVAGLHMQLDILLGFRFSRVFIFATPAIWTAFELRTTLD